MTNDDSITVWTTEVELAGWWGVCTAEGDIVTMYFRNAVITQKFIDFCKRRGVRGKTRLEGTKYIVTANVLEHERANFVATWAGMTMEGAPKQAFKQNTNYMTTLTDDSPMPFGKYGPKSKDPRPLKKVPAGYLLWMWEGNAGPELWQKPDDLLHQYIASRFTVIEKDAPDFIVEHRPDVPRS